MHSLKDIAAGAIVATLSTTLVIWWDPPLWLQGLSHATRLCVAVCIPILGYGIPAAVRWMVPAVHERDLARWRAHVSSTTGIFDETLGARPLRKLDVFVMGATGSVFVHTFWGFSDHMLRFADEHCEWEHDSRTIVLRATLGLAGTGCAIACKEAIGYSSRARRTARRAVYLCLGMWLAYGTAKVPTPHHQPQALNPKLGNVNHEPRNPKPGSGLSLGALLPDCT